MRQRKTHDTGSVLRVVARSWGRPGRACLNCGVQKVEGRVREGGLPLRGAEMALANHMPPVPQEVPRRLQVSLLTQAPLLLSLRMGLGLHMQQVGDAGPTDRLSRQAHLGISGSRGASLPRPKSLHRPLVSAIGSTRVSMTAAEFKKKWSRYQGKESADYQEGYSRPGPANPA
jgi:hypothetical protein